MKIKLLKPHRHAGTNFLVGAVIDVDLDTSNYLANLKVATPIGEVSKWFKPSEVAKVEKSVEPSVVKPIEKSIETSIKPVNVETGEVPDNR